MSNRKFILYINGMPGTGKLTVAKEFCKHRNDSILIDNHKVNNAVFQVVDITKKLPEKVFYYLARMNDIILEAIEHCSPKDKNIILTNVFFEGDPDGERKVRQLEELCNRIGYEFVPVRLICHADELKNRLVSDERKQNMKLTDVALLESFIAGKEVLYSKHENEITIENTSLAPLEVVKAIESHIKNIL